MLPTLRHPWLSPLSVHGSTRSLRVTSVVSGDRDPGSNPDAFGNVLVTFSAPVTLTDWAPNGPNVLEIDNGAEFIAMNYEGVYSEQPAPNIIRLWSEDLFFPFDEGPQPMSGNVWRILTARAPVVVPQQGLVAPA